MTEKRDDTNSKIFPQSQREEELSNFKKMSKLWLEADKILKQLEGREFEDRDTNNIKTEKDHK